MPRIQFIEKNFQRKSLRVIAKANEIIAEYEALGFTLTLRQLYYQFVARDLLDAASAQYKEDIWRTQPFRVEVWVEKDALVGIIEPACNELRLPFFACSGYTSQSAQYEAGMRFRGYMLRGQRVIVLHLGDHDPSGIDMTRDNDERARMFSRALGRQFKMLRLALNYDQVEEYDPPPNPAKISDSRFTGYEAEHGPDSWELDALDPRIIDRLIRDTVAKIVDQNAFDAALAEETANRKRLTKHADNFEWLNGQ